MKKRYYVIFVLFVVATIGLMLSSYFNRKPNIIGSYVYQDPMGSSMWMKRVTIDQDHEFFLYDSKTNEQVDYGVVKQIDDFHYQLIGQEHAYDIMVKDDAIYFPLEFDQNLRVAKMKKEGRLVYPCPMTKEGSSYRFEKNAKCD